MAGKNGEKKEKRGLAFRTSLTVKRISKYQRLVEMLELIGEDSGEKSRFMADLMLDGLKWRGMGDEEEYNLGYSAPGFTPAEPTPQPKSVARKPNSKDEKQEVEDAIDELIMS